MTHAHPYGEFPQQGDGTGGCTGACCARFYLPHPKGTLKRMAAEGIRLNGSADETRLIAGMVVPLDGGRCVAERIRDGRKVRIFAFTCRHWKDGLCSIYARRPVVCRTHPCPDEDWNPQGGCALDKDACTLKGGTPWAQARKEFGESLGKNTL